MEKIHKSNSMFFDTRYLDIWFDKTSTFNKLNSFINPLRFEDFNNFSISPYFEKYDH